MDKHENAAIREATGAFIRSLLEMILPPIRAVAIANGYAVAVHGSLKRDIDLIAVAWTDQAIAAADLVQAVRGAVAGVTGRCLILGEGMAKPHGRIAYTLVHGGFAGEIDLSIVGPREPMEAK